MKIFCVIGEESGDKHGTAVLAELKRRRPDLEIAGTGGIRFERLADRRLFGTEDLAVVGLWEVLKRGWFLRRVFSELLAVIESSKPDVILLVDYPGMNLRLAERIRKTRSGKPLIVWYVCPQVWSWKKKRAFKLKRLTDALVALFPFEVDFLRNYAGMEAVCFGHPFRDRYREIVNFNAPPSATRWKKKGFVEVAVLPGSRPNEVQSHFPVLCRAIKLARLRMPELRFFVAKASQISAKTLMELGLDELPEVETVVEDGDCRVHRADLAWCASGTACLECAVLRTPPVIFYRVSPVTAWLGRHVFGIKTVGLPNVLLKRKVFPELLQKKFNPENLLLETSRLIAPDGLASKKHSVYDELELQLGGPDSYAKTAGFIADLIRRSASEKTLPVQGSISEAGSRRR